jgi:hypothetical protein
MRTNNQNTILPAGYGRLVDPISSILESRLCRNARCFDDGRLALDNNPAERALRGVAIGRKNYLFPGSDAGGRRAVAMYTLIESVKLNGFNPQHYLTDVLACIANHPARHIAELLPLN